MMRSWCNGERRSRSQALVGLGLIVAWVGALGWDSAGWSQEPRPARPATGGGAGPAKVGSTPTAGPGELPGEAKPEVHYLPDKEGTLQPVLGFSLEDFEALYKLKNNLDQREQKPRYTIDKLSVAGEAPAARAELTVQLTITLRDAQWIRVPLRLDNVVLREPPKHEGGGKALVHFQDAREGYVCWLKGDPAQPQTLSLSVLAPLSAGAGETRLRLPAPRATVSE